MLDSVDIAYAVIANNFLCAVATILWKEKIFNKAELLILWQFSIILNLWFFPNHQFLHLGNDPQTQVNK